ncbi:hypothetical protein BASA50_010520 [Batrachochytrium salamandrivorans]|uniref:RxLR effector protein n=1 Tax=Batrachochytrium salamandrivorans TaxID=1357716 RepID=A0ABQ8EY81_9FUNG|nr:hypothetical protein BASA60_008703 [Batrachochytrium salamandrivorans]KAH6588719.1 hypothetical protein BASA50_010520 [Batrachochytrium salamandrivorans]
MRVNVLVVAAMVITSVNAGWRKKDAGGNRHNDGRKTSKGPLGLTVRPLSLVLPSKSSESEPSSELSPKSPVHPLSLVLPQTSSESDESTSQKPDHPKKTPVCDPIVIELYTLWGKAYVLDLTIQTQMPILSNIVKEESESNALKIKKVEDWFESHPGDKATIKEMRTEHADLMREYYEVWKQFLGSGCLVKDFMELSPDNNDKKWLLFLVARRGYSSTRYE